MQIDPNMTGGQPLPEEETVDTETAALTAEADPPEADVPAPDEETAPDALPDETQPAPGEPAAPEEVAADGTPLTAVAPAPADETNPDTLPGQETPQADAATATPDNQDPPPAPVPAPPDAGSDTAILSKQDGPQTPPDDVTPPLTIVPPDGEVWEGVPPPPVMVPPPPDNPVTGAASSPALSPITAFRTVDTSAAPADGNANPKQMTMPGLGEQVLFRSEDDDPESEDETLFASFVTSVDEENEVVSLFIMRPRFATSRGDVAEGDGPGQYRLQ